MSHVFTVTRSYVVQHSGTKGTQRVAMVACITATMLLGCGATEIAC